MLNKITFCIVALAAGSAFGQVNTKKAYDKMQDTLVGKFDAILGRINTQTVVVEKVDTVQVSSIDEEELDRLRKEVLALDKRFIIERYGQQKPGKKNDGQRYGDFSRSKYVQSVLPTQNQIHIFFAFSSASTDLEVYQEFERVEEWLRNNPTKKLIIEGYTDRVGSELFNQALSLERAKCVANFLQEGYGISQDRLQLMGYGYTGGFRVKEPEADFLNRRVTLIME